MTERTPWQALLAMANAFAISPAQFWRLSLAEWRALVAPHAGEVLTRQAFDVLAHRFPDKS